MKVFCLYAVIDVKTGFGLACGKKYKDFESGSIRYIKDNYERRDFPFFWLKYPCYYRTIEIKGRQCLIYYWVDRYKGEMENLVYPFGNAYFLNGRSHFFNPPKYIELIEHLGVF